MVANFVLFIASDQCFKMNIKSRERARLRARVRIVDQNPGTGTHTIIVLNLIYIEFINEI
jgi:hypothetical protein